MEKKADAELALQESKEKREKQKNKEETPRHSLPHFLLLDYNSIAPASKLFSLTVEGTLIEFNKTVLLIEFSVGLRVCKKAERFSAMVFYIRKDAFL